MRGPTLKALCFLMLVLAVMCSAAFAESLSDAEEVPIQGFSQEETASAFVAQAMNIRTRSTRLFPRHTAGSRLTGINLKVYERLSEDFRLVANAIAETNEAGGIPTVFSYPVEDLLEKRTYTLEELGLDTFLAENGKTLSSEAKQALDAAMGRDFQLVIQSVLADYPYEIYWYDKTGKVIISSPTYTLSKDRTSITIGGSYTFRIPVMEEYALTAEEAPETYVYDPGHTETVNTALDEAQSIVDRYRDLPDEEKLRAYMDEIIRITDYNHDAAEHLTFGNPWQLIWVFDTDDQTKVVCEGFAKAFQYLCDLTEFSGDVTCISPTGRILRDGKEENHMWNIVSLDGGKTNYLVDVTLGDGSYPDSFFMALPVGGSLEEGYVIVYGADGTVRYVYSSTARNVYSSGQLTLSIHEPDAVSTDSAEASASPAPTPTAAATEAADAENGGKNFTPTPSGTAESSSATPTPSSTAPKASEPPTPTADRTVSPTAAPKPVRTSSWTDTAVYTEISFRVIWNGLKENEQPPEIMLVLYRNGKVYDKRPRLDKYGWYHYYGLPESGDYCVYEEYVPGFSTSYSNTGIYADITDRAMDGGSIINTRVPKTGDTQPLGLWLLGIVLSAGLLTGIVSGRKRI